MAATFKTTSQPHTIKFSSNVSFFFSLSLIPFSFRYVSKLLRHSGRHFIYTNDFVHFYFSALFGTRIFTNGGKKYITKRETKTTITNERRRRKKHFLFIPVGFRGSKKKYVSASSTQLSTKTRSVY